MAKATRKAARLSQGMDGRQFGVSKSGWAKEVDAYNKKAGKSATGYLDPYEQNQSNRRGMRIGSNSINTGEGASYGDYNKVVNGKKIVSRTPSLELLSDPELRARASRNKNSKSVSLAEAHKSRLTNDRQPNYSSFDLTDPNSYSNRKLDYMNNNDYNQSLLWEGQQMRHPYQTF